VAAEAKAFFASRGIEVTMGQQTKTKAAMEFYKAELKPQAIASIS
jgi:hypothetical protein